MPVPKRKRSKSRRDKRFANKGLKPKSFSLCTQCSEPLVPHVACKKCGFYKGAKVIQTKSDRSVVRADKKAAAPQAQSAQESKD